MNEYLPSDVDVKMKNDKTVYRSRSILNVRSHPAMKELQVSYCNIYSSNPEAPGSCGIEAKTIATGLTYHPTNISLAS